jgi:histidinol-phosphate aminotransferase
MGLSYVPTQANFIFLDTGKDCRLVFDKLLQKGVIVRTGDIFGYPNHLRVTIGTAEENNRFIEALQTVLGNLS